MSNFIAGAVIVLLVGLAAGYIYKEKKKGTHCIGCPMAGNCHKTKTCK
ncbi:FeoB-associated Cys-rich membrane protein [Butyrivibrio sp. INlla16]|nr:FeoB-associated Cys-rich membrane protein [Butyrivibrio sp. INlla16]SDB58571.1 Virus attachment protein p12 family [Butyrivibrio sp. INlla16]